MVKEGYKRTEVGVIPESWKVIPITKATNEIFLGLTARVDYVESGGIPLVRATDIAKGKLSFDKARTISVQQHKKLTKYRRAKRGDVLVSKSGSLGVCAIVDTDQEFSIYESIIVLQANSSLDSKFLLSLIRDEQTQVRMIGEKVGSTVGHLNLEMFRKLVIPLPPLPEQRAIAQTLSDVDALIASLDKLIAKQRHLKTATMQQLLTGKKRLPGFGGEWLHVELGELGSFSKGSGIRKDDVLEFGLPCVRYGEIYTRHHDVIREFYSFISPKIASECQLLKKGDLLFAGSGETAEEIGKCVAFLHDKVAYAGGDIVILSPQDQDSLFLGYLMNHESVVKQKARMGQGDAVVHIQAKNLAKLQFCLPPLEEQRAIATVLSDMDAAISALETRRAKTQAIKQGMMQELLTGRSRLV